MNTYSICVFVRFQMWLYTQLLVDQTQKYFEYFICVLKVFLYFCVFRVFVQNVYFLFLSKNSFRGIFASKSQVSSSHENEDDKNKKTLQFIQRVSWLSRKKQLPVKIDECFNGIFAGNFARSLPAKSTFLQFLKANSNSFSNICILPPPGLSQPKTHFLSKPHPKLKINHF